MLFFLFFIGLICKLRSIHNFEWKKHFCQFFIIDFSFIVAIAAETFLNFRMV
jgi:hypothetical protein